jgi:hypothetical protein
MSSIPFPLWDFNDCIDDGCPGDARPRS